MSPLVGPHVAPLIGFEVAEGALKRLLTSVRALMRSDLPRGEKESAKPLRVNTMMELEAQARGSPTTSM